MDGWMRVDGWVNEGGWVVDGGGWVDKRFDRMVESMFLDG